MNAEEYVSAVLLNGIAAYDIEGARGFADHNHDLESEFAQEVYMHKNDISDEADIDYSPDEEEAWVLSVYIDIQSYFLIIPCKRTYYSS